ncbi:MAG: Gfo/Idh/MocA family oxidoreductase [candidate division Zixibacteria bacterium]|nr:Gfo/Idh/MocA family oxidoreductase [candidate division Zixibacteria bacterium]
MNRIKTGVIGTGHLGRFHAKVYSQLDGAELVGVYDIDQDKAKKVAIELGTNCFSELNQLLKEIEAASLVVPTSSHFEVGKEILESDVHLLVEKPIAQTVEQAEKLIVLAKEKNLTLQVGHIERFNPAFLAIENLKLNPKFIESHRLALFNPRGTDVAVVLDLMIHDIDLILSLVKSELIDIQAASISVITESEDIANARLTFENGTVANITASRISANNMRKIRFFQKNSYISLDLLRKEAEIYRLVDLKDYSLKEGEPSTIIGKIPTEQIGKTILYEKPKIEDRDMLTLEISSFLEAVRNGKKPKVTGEDGKRALEVALKIIEKSSQHRKRMKEI